MIELQGVNELLKILKDSVPTSDDIVKPSESVASGIVSAVQMAAPKLTGGLSASIRMYKKKKKNGVTIGPEYGKGGGNHAHLIEYGHISRDGKTFVPAQPFIRPTWAKIKSNVERDLKEAISKKMQQKYNG